MKKCKNNPECFVLDSDLFSRDFVRVAVSMSICWGFLCVARVWSSVVDKLFDVWLKSVLIRVLSADWLPSRAAG